MAAMDSQCNGGYIPALKITSVTQNHYDNSITTCNSQKQVHAPC